MALLQAAFEGMRGALLTAPFVLHLLLADILLSVLLPLSLCYPTLGYDLSSHLAGPVWQRIQRLFTRSNGAAISVSGVALPAGESAIVVANHVSWSDFYPIQELAMASGMLGRCRYFAKSQLRWVPFLGWGLWAMGMPLVTRNWTQDQREMDRVFGGIVRNKWPIWLISYSEGTRYTLDKYTQAVRWCRANGRALPQHTLHPRTKGFVSTVQQLRVAPHIKAIYDLTIAYAKRVPAASEGSRDEWLFLEPPSIWQTLATSELRQTWKIHVHVERHLIHELPTGDEELKAWLEERWVEKGKRLEVLRKQLMAEQDWAVVETEKAF